MSVNYTTYVAQLSNLLAVQSSLDTNFQTALPGIIDYAEQRIYRELDLLVTRVTDASGFLTANSRTFNLPTTIGSYLVVEEFATITPSSVTAASSISYRTPAQAVSRQFIDNVFPSPTGNAGVPIFFNMINGTTVLLGPSPDLAYNVEVTGTQRPVPLSSANSSTFLTQVLPDLFMAASMVFGSAYQRDFGSQADDPAKAQSWEGQYKMLMASANVEELRKAYKSQAWTNQLPNQIATPPRV